MPRRLHSIGVFCWLLAVATSVPFAQETPARRVLVKAAVSADQDDQIRLIGELVRLRDPLVEQGLVAWRQNELFLLDPGDGISIPVLLDAQLDDSGKSRAIRLLDGAFVKDAAGVELRYTAADLTAADTTAKLRKAIKATMDLHALSDPIAKVRRDATTKLGQEQNREYLVYFTERLSEEADAEVKDALQEALALTRAVDPDQTVRVNAINELGEMRSVNGIGFLQELVAKGKADPSKYGAETVAAARTAVKQIESYLWWGNLLGTAFRGLSLAAVLLVAALGLAITFGLMGVINMAHGEIMMVGAYTAYVVQNIFKGWFGA
ncbi:MAG TPA: urea ABC transporter permease subunit UrtB, partial [Verrucomicrobiales bacterium]|nr:urea ABC transporter permease subunit UrtB [Verrucomicrobiales bacterium]